MSRLSATAHAWFDAHHGAASADELNAVGITRAMRQRLVRMGVLVCVERGVYVLIGAPATLEQRCRIQCLAHPSGYITGPTGGMLGDIRRMPRSTRIHLAVRHGLHLPPVSGVHYRQTRAMAARDWWVRPDGIKVARWARLAFDLAADLGPRDHTSAVHQMLDRKLVGLDELHSIGARLVHPARPGSTTFAHTMASLSDGRVHQSDPEVRLAADLRSQGVPVEAQVPLTVAGRTIHLDLGVPSARWGIELDIHPAHRSTEGQHADALRRHLVNTAGWIQETVTELDLDDWSAAIDRLVSSYDRARRQWSVGAQTLLPPTLHRPQTLR